MTKHATRETSPEVAAIAARLVRYSDDELRIAMNGVSPPDGPSFFDQIRSVAASCLAQREDDPRNPASQGRGEGA